MASPTSASHPYSYQKPSTMATRSLITSKNPTQTPSASSGSYDGGEDQPRVLQRKTTNNYEQALASSQQASNETARPGLDRVQSFNKNDYKRELMQQTLANASSAGSGQGYFSTAAQ